jgi:hypothetical protein
VDLASDKVESGALSVAGAIPFIPFCLYVCATQISFDINKCGQQQKYIFIFMGRFG